MKNTQKGRSMVEMLGVLAIIGVLSVGGIAGYTVAMNRYRANQILDMASKIAIIAQTMNGGAGGGACVAGGCSVAGTNDVGLTWSTLGGVTGFSAIVDNTGATDSDVVTVTLAGTPSTGVANAMTSIAGTGTASTPGYNGSNAIYIKTN